MDSWDCTQRFFPLHEDTVVVGCELEAFFRRAGLNFQCRTRLEPLISYGLVASTEPDDLIAGLHLGYWNQTPRGPNALVGFQTPETVVEALVRGDTEGRGFLLVVWVGTETCEAGSLASEGRKLGGHLDDPGRLSDLFYAAL